jgi:Erv1 / Alr family
MIPEVGNALWIMLHAYALFYPCLPNARDRMAAERWLDVFGALVNQNSRGCKRCATEWDKILQIMRPDLSSRDAFYLWTLAAHDRVNRRLGRALMHPKLTLQHPLLVAT